uniref:Uncharacterized protein n=1 Tax=Tanacetum cinerariifolium TaxID=118510 RepID=A0A6L2KFP9_TANCI|nr:hypothetical protein CRG98_028121 [Tanacetum cinerariifolium]
MQRINRFVDFRTELVEESTKKDVAEKVQGSSAKRGGDELEEKRSIRIKKSAELKQCLEIISHDEDDVTIDATPLFSIKLLKNFDREELEVLSRLVKDRFVKTNPVDHMDSFLLHTLKTVFEHHVEYNVWKHQQGLTKVKNWKLYDSCGVHYVTMQNILYYLLVEKMYPLTNHTLRQMFNNVKLQVDSTLVKPNDISLPICTTSGRVSEPPQFYYGFHIEEDKISDSTLSELDRPSNYKEAMASPKAAKRKEAMKSDIQSMYDNQMDVKTTFLKGKLIEDEFMAQLKVLKMQSILKEHASFKWPLMNLNRLLVVGISATMRKSHSLDFLKAKMSLVYMSKSVGVL